MIDKKVMKRIKKEVKEQAEYFRKLAEEVMLYLRDEKNLGAYEAELLFSVVMRDMSQQSLTAIEKVLSTPKRSKEVDEYDGASDFVVGCVEINKETIDLMEKRIAYFARALLIIEEGQKIKEKTK